MIKWIKKQLMKLLRSEMEEMVTRAVSNAYRPLIRRIDAVQTQLANAVDVGVDLHHVHPERTTIWVMSRFGEGRIEHVEVPCGSLQGCVKLVRDIKERYGHGRTYVDSMPPTARMFRDMVD